MSTTSKHGLLATVFFLISALSTVVHAESGQGFSSDTGNVELFVAATPRPGIVEGCELYVYADTTNNPWHEVAQPVQLKWMGGELKITGQAPHPADSDARNAAKMLQEMCFRLKVDGEFVAGGAIISQQSARNLRFPVLALQPANGHASAPVLHLHAQWPPNTLADGSFNAIKLLETRQTTMRRVRP